MARTKKVDFSREIGHLMGVNQGKIHKYISKDLTFRTAIALGTDVVREMQAIQNTYPIATMAVGRAMMAAALMASQLKNDQLISLYFRGDGPLEMFFAEADFEGHTRGYVPHPQLQLPDGELSVGSAIGQGLLSVVHSHPQQRAPQRGTVALQTGEVADDVAFYLLQSQQVRSLISLGVKVNAYGMVQGAAGVMIELMPGAPENLVAQLEKNFEQTTSLSELVAQGGAVEDIQNEYFKGLAIEELDHSHALTYQCRCSRERLGHALALLGHMEVESMIQKNEAAQARCEFCGRGYTLEIPELQVLLEKLRSGPIH